MIRSSAAACSSRSGSIITASNARRSHSVLSIRQFQLRVGPRSRFAQQSVPGCEPARRLASQSFAPPHPKNLGEGFWGTVPRRDQDGCGEASAPRMRIGGWGSGGEGRPLGNCRSHVPDIVSAEVWQLAFTEQKRSFGPSTVNRHPVFLW